MSPETLAATAPPLEIIGQFYPKGVSNYTRLSGGKVNKTFKVTDVDDQVTVLQKMASILNPASAADQAIVAERLKGDGWEVAEPLRSIDGELVVSDNLLANWRGYSYLDSDELEPPSDILAHVSSGLMIGRLSVSLARLDYVPKSSIPHHHDSQHYASKLIGIMPNMPGRQQDFAAQLVCALAKEPPITGNPKVIHGDTKLENALYRRGMPFTMIDWDNLMLGAPILDLADLLRSITGQQRESLPQFRATDLLPIIKAYRFGAKSDNQIGLDGYFEQAVSATRTLSLSLAMRYLIDTTSPEGQSYFQWDPQKFVTADAHNQYRARRQWLNYLALL